MEKQPLESVIDVPTFAHCSKKRRSYIVIVGLISSDLYTVVKKDPAIALHVRQEIR